MIRVLLAEEQKMLRSVRAASLVLEGDMELVAEVSRGEEVVVVAQATRPEVALLSIDLAGHQGIALAAELHKELPSCRIIILTTFHYTGYDHQMEASGVFGVFFKDMPSAQLAMAIRRAVAGRQIVDPMFTG